MESCVTCGNEVAAPYCAHCGERRASDRQYSVASFMREHVIEALSSLDGRVIRTARTLVNRPGELTAAFMRGSRIPYLAPLQCFLIFNLAFFVWSSFTGQTVLDTPLTVHLHGMPYSATARRMVDERIAQGKLTAREFEQRFDTIEATQARTLVLAMVPAFAIVVGVAAIDRRRFAVQHLVFSLHTYSALFILMAVMTFAVGIPVTLLLRGLGVKPGQYGYDSQISFMLLVLIAAYVAASLRRAYELPWLRSVLTALVCTLAIAEIVQLYRRLLFFVTLQSM